MITVYKYRLALTSEQGVVMPIASEILDIMKTDRAGELEMWARVDTDRNNATRVIVCCGTGHEAPPYRTAHIATVRDEAFVWHFFDGGYQ